MTALRLSNSQRLYKSLLGVDADNFYFLDDAGNDMHLQHILF